MAELANGSEHSACGDRVFASRHESLAEYPLQGFALRPRTNSVQESLEQGTNYDAQNTHCSGYDRKVVAAE